MSPVDPARREEFLDYLAREHQGVDVIYRQYGPVPKIPLKSHMLTWAATGGVPIGHFCRWYGPEGSGKTLTNWGLIEIAQRLPEYLDAMLEIDLKWLERQGKKGMAVLGYKKRVKEMQNRFPNGMEVCIFDTEQRADLWFASQLGIDVKRLEVIDNNVIEEVIKDATKALESFHIVIIDSATNAQSIAEANLEPGSYEQGTSAKAWSRLKQFRRKMDRLENTLIIVDQVRSTGLGSGKMYQGPDTAPPNVRFLRHNASLAIQYDTGKKLYLDKNLDMTDNYEKATSDIKSLGTDGKEQHGIEMRCKVIKNSTGRPHRNARMRFRFPVADIKTGELIQDVGFDQEFEMVEFGLYFEMIEKSGSYFYLLDDDGNRISKGMHGESKVRNVIAEDEDLQERLLGRLYADMGNR